MVHIMYKGENLVKSNNTFQNIIDKLEIKPNYNDINIKKVEFIFTNDYILTNFIFVKYGEEMILDKYIDYKYLIIRDFISG
jgi:hypothetical protein